MTLENFQKDRDPPFLGRRESFIHSKPKYRPSSALSQFLLPISESVGKAFNTLREILYHIVIKIIKWY